MTIEEIKLLSTPEVAKVLLDHANESPEKFALKYKGPYPIHLLATQLRLNKKASEKLPSWVNKGCIFETEALEQCSSEIAAESKPWGKGKLALDLTCGLGVDASFLCKNHEQVIALEPDPVKLELAKINFERLGLKNILFEETMAEKFIQHWNSDSVDLVYIDPSRRSEDGKRNHSPLHNSPDVITLLPLLKRIAKRILLKTSPMFDIREGMKILNEISSVHVISVKNQVREVLYEIIPGWNEKPSVQIHILPDKNIFSFDSLPQQSTTEFEEIPFSYILEPDVAFYMAGFTQELFQKYFPDVEGSMNHPTGYFFSNTAPGNFPGRIFRIKESLPWKPSEVRKKIKSLGEKSIQITRRNFDIPLAEINDQLKLKEGGEDFLILTKMQDGKRMCFVSERVTGNHGYFGYAQ